MVGSWEFVGAATTAWLLTVKLLTGEAVAALLAKTLSVRNLPNCAVVGVKVIELAPDIGAQSAGFVDTTEATRVVQLNHW
jgi:hypothetical protein